MLGSTVFRVMVTTPPSCVDCGLELDDDDAAADPGAARRCRPCSAKAEAGHRNLGAAARSGRRSAVCGRDAGGGDARSGEVVCAACRADLHDLARRLLEHANAGDRALSVRHRGCAEGDAAQSGRQRAGTTTVPTRNPSHPLAAAPQHRCRARHRHRARCFLFHPQILRGRQRRPLAARRGGTLPADDAVRIILQVLHGLEHAHNQGIVHRDLIPHNVLLTGTDRTAIAKIGDFGLGKAFALAGLSSLTRTGTAVGMLG
jgi:eukaryotic-like serine/threonine-protein kinase